MVRVIRVAITPESVPSVNFVHDVNDVAMAYSYQIGQQFCHNKHNKAEAEPEAGNLYN